MINSRKIEDLHPHVAGLCREHIERCREQGIEIIVTSTFRDKESQNALYAQGRTAPGAKVTNAKGGQSFHNWHVAYDVVPVVNGKAVWNDEGLWRKIGQIGQEVGLEWGGAWTSFQDKPHFQFTGGLTLADFNAGKSLTV